MGDFIITEFEGAFEALDHKGRKRNFISRQSACFIITKRGKIRFSCVGGEVISELDHPVFLPKGCSYTNECLEEAESIVFNFQTLKAPTKPTELSEISYDVAKDCFNQINAYSAARSFRSSILILKELYSLSSNLFLGVKDKPKCGPIVEDAMVFMQTNYGRAGLSVADVAEHCSVSAVYLRKLFNKELNKKPQAYLTDIRMERARLLVLEKRAIHEVAEEVGYSDVYQFSRAYKRYYGYSPTKT